MKKTVGFILGMCLLMGSITFAQAEPDAVNSAGYGSTYVIKSDGSLWGCGSQYVGNGKGYKEKQISFVQIMENVKSVSCGGFQNTVAVKQDKTLWGWGSFDGYPEEKEEYDPTFLTPTKLSIDNVVKASNSNRFILALKEDKTLWICGDMIRGDGTEKMASSKKGFEKVAEHVVTMFATDESVFYITEDGKLWGYGKNHHAQIGNGAKKGDPLSKKDFVTKPFQILEDVKYVTGNKDSGVMMAIRKDNSLYAWGEDGFYTEENGWVEDAGKPYRVMDSVKSCAVNGDAAFVTKLDNSLWSWGRSYDDKKVSNEKSIRKIGEDVLSVTLGERHASILKTDNSLWTMGGAYRGGLGYEIKATWRTPLTKILDNVMDKPADWANDIVKKAIGEKLIPETLQNNYTKPITREEFCILAIRMIEVKSGIQIQDYLKNLGTEAAPVGTFEDCDTYEVRAAKVLGITKGTSQTTFEPHKILTRQEAATLLTNTALACGRHVNLSTPAYKDASEIADWAKPYTGYVYDIGVMKGIGNNQFAPKMSYQRQQAFITMYKIWQAIDKVNPQNVKIDKGEKQPEKNESNDKDTQEQQSIDDIKAALTYKPYEEDYMATFQGTYTTKEKKERIEKSIYYRCIQPHMNVQIREDDYRDGKIASIKIYNDPADVTFIRMYKYSNYAETVEGDQLSVQYLNPNVFDTLEKNEENKEFHAEYKYVDNEKVLYTLQVKKDFTKIEQWFSLKYNMPIRYRKETGTTEKDHAVEEWKLLTVKESYDILDFIFDESKIK